MGEPREEGVVWNSLENQGSRGCKVLDHCTVTGVWSWTLMVHLDRPCSVLSLEVPSPCSRGVCLGQRARVLLEGRVCTCGMTQ